MPLFFFFFIGLARVRHTFLFGGEFVGLLRGNSHGSSNDLRGWSVSHVPGLLRHSGVSAS